MFNHRSPSSPACATVLCDNSCGSRWLPHTIAMRSQIVPSRPQPKHKSAKSKWRKVPRTVGLYEYLPSGVFFAKIRKGEQYYRQSLQTKDLPFAKRKLEAFRNRLDRTDPRFGKVTFVAWLEQNYFPTLRGSAGALAAKRRVIEKVKRHWLQARTQPMRDLKESQLLAFMNEHYGCWSEVYWNSALSLLRDALSMAVRDRVIVESPAANLRYRKRKKPVRPTPTYEQFQALVADIRAQPFNAGAQDSADFIEFLGLAGLGQAEASSLTRADVDFEAEQMICYRYKTNRGFVVPIFPQLRPLLERLCAGKKPHQKIFRIRQAKRALGSACKRLGFVRESADGRLLPAYSHRSLRRAFITRAIEKGVDVKVIAQWQGHSDEGALILKTYSHVRPIHSRRMAALMTDEQPENVVPLHASSAPGAIGDAQ